MALAQQVMIITKDGLLLMEHKFREGTQGVETDPDLFSGMLSAILSVGKETGGGLVQTIQQDKYKVIVSEGEHIYVLLFIDEESRELENIARVIAGRFEAKYEEELTEIISDINVFSDFRDDLNEIYAQLFTVDAELLTRLIPELTNIMNVSIFEKPMNHQVYTGPRDSFVNEHELAFQELAVNIIEAQTEFTEKTLEFQQRTIVDYNNRTVVLENLGSHILMIVGKDSETILGQIKKIKRKANIPSRKR
ncbi:MAG: hypothetical protein U9O98_00220 [Asgard group archaeon]|nr:hypothetical protein [Asgard group archaeon]